MKPFNQYLSEAVPTNNTGSIGANAGLSGLNPYSAIQGYDKRLFPLGDDILDQDYQTPGQSGQAMWRYSNVYPVQKLTDQDVDNMVDASKEYVNMQDENIKKRVKKTFSSFMEEAPVNNASSGAIAGLPPDTPPVKQKKKYIYGGSGSRKMWLINKKDGK